MTSNIFLRSWDFLGFAPFILASQSGNSIAFYAWKRFPWAVWDLSPKAVLSGMFHATHISVANYRYYHFGSHFLFWAIPPSNQLETFVLEILQEKITMKYKQMLFYIFTFISFYFMLFFLFWANNLGLRLDQKATSEGPWSVSAVRAFRAQCLSWALPACRISLRSPILPFSHSAFGVYAWRISDMENP